MAKKSFSANMPAELFVTAPAPETQTTPAQETEPAPEGYYINPKYIEAKSKRVQLLLQPSVYAAAKEQADREGKSFNDFVNTLLKEHTQG